MKRLLLWLACCSLAGCIPMGKRDASVIAEPGQPHELPPRQAAELCEVAGRELEQNAREAEAIAQYERARQLDPKRTHLARKLAVLYDRQGDATHAGKEYHEALRLSPHDADLFNDVGYFHYQSGNLPEAENWLRGALKEKPAHERAAVNLGIVLGKQGRFDESLKSFSLVLAPAQARCNVGMLMALAGRTDEARSAIRQALQLEPGLRQAQVLLARLEKPTPEVQRVEHRD